MFGSIRKKQLNATTAIAVLALVFAMTGGAWAAKKYLITSTKQISPSVLKALKGASGKNGASGSPGAAGLAGPTGPGGPQGGSGQKGETGQKGEQGPPGAEGKKGEKGATGSPWAPDSQLPEKATETGTWAFGPVTSGTEVHVVVASFAVKLKAALDALHVHYINANKKEELAPGEEVTSTACLGTVSEPAATSGSLCVYAAEVKAAETGTVAIARPDNTGEGASNSGALQQFNATANGAEGHGTWAVTG